ncbi:Fatty acid desaturase [Tautonia plasticadhaerens]|uniref:Fatty acid desaturase n=2 Tax=Tautonia plasticadhaerens TaxID=2527974 RepID=A0A518H4S5_9BACT|nr:Fatty acid desaturase [Tautonia plasticadhaerens]
MASTTPRPAFNAPGLRRRIRDLRRVDSLRGLGYLAIEYACLAAVIAGAVVFAEGRAGWGLAWAWNVPVFASAIVLVGAIQHRLAGLGHEASHSCLLRDKVANDLAADLLCMFPLLSTIHSYRAFHLAHHQYTNDPGRDPDLVNLGPGKRSGEFPMSRRKLLVAIYLAPLSSPRSFLRYQWAYIAVNVLGIGRNVYAERQGEAGPRLLPATSLGLAYVSGLEAVLWGSYLVGSMAWLVVAGAAGLVAVLLATRCLPVRAFARPPIRHPYGPRTAGALRLSYYTAVIVLLGLLLPATGGRSAVYAMLLWFVPMSTTFMYFMYLRDVYQHSNADEGRLTNSRVFRCDPFTTWAVFVYGQGYHVTHHLFPTIPQDRLGPLHRLLREEHPEYASQVVECHGTFADRLGRPTIVDVLTAPRPDGRPGREDAPGAGGG